MEQLVEYEVIEEEEDGHVEGLEPEHRAKQQHDQEGHRDALHCQQPCVHQQSRMEHQL